MYKDDSWSINLLQYLYIFFEIYASYSHLPYIYAYAVNFPNMAKKMGFLF